MNIINFFKKMFGSNKALPKFCDLNGKVAVVTGAKQGMGKAHALTLAKAGAKVTVADLDLAGCQLVVDEIKKMRGEAIAVKCDMSNKSEIDNLMSETMKNFGKIDILVNNAGIFPFKPFLEMQEADFQKVIDINLKGYFFAAQAAAKEMQKNQPDGKGLRGSIVNIASVAAIMGFAGLSHYCASKGGVVAMSKAIALELAPLGIRINNVDPGAIETPCGNMITCRLHTASAGRPCALPCRCSCFCFCWPSCGSRRGYRPSPASSRPFWWLGWFIGCRRKKSFPPRSLASRTVCCQPAGSRSMPFCSTG